MIASCVPAPSPALTATAATTPTSRPAALTPTLEPTMVLLTPSPAFFVGLWKCCTGYELHKADGSYRFEHTLAALLSRPPYGRISAEGNVMTYVEDSPDCRLDQVGKYNISIMDADAYRLTLIEDPCIWRATTGSAPLDGGTFYRLRPMLPFGIYAKTLSAQDAEAAGASLGPLAGRWELQLHEDGTFDLRHDGQLLDSDGYFDAERQFMINAPKLCAGHGEALGTFKVQLEENKASFFWQKADCQPLIFVLRTNTWVRQ